MLLFLCLLDGQCNWGLGSFLPIDEGWTWVEEQVDYQWSCILWEEHLPRGEERYMSDTLQTLLLVHICALGDKFKKVVLFCLKWMPETIHMQLALAVSVSLSVASDWHQSTLSQTFSVSSRITSHNRACAGWAHLPSQCHAVPTYCGPANLWTCVDWMKETTEKDELCCEIVVWQTTHSPLNGGFCGVVKLHKSYVLWCHSHLVLNMYRVNSNFPFYM